MYELPTVVSRYPTDIELGREHSFKYAIQLEEAGLGQTDRQHLEDPSIYACRPIRCRHHSRGDGIDVSGTKFVENNGDG